MYAIKNVEAKLEVLQAAENDIYSQAEKQLRALGLDAEADEFVRKQQKVVEAMQAKKRKQEEDIRRMILDQEQANLAALRLIDPDRLEK